MAHSEGTPGPEWVDKPGRDLVSGGTGQPRTQQDGTSPNHGKNADNWDLVTPRGKSFMKYLLSAEPNEGTGWTPQTLAEYSANVPKFAFWIFQKFTLSKLEFTFSMKYYKYWLIPRLANKIPVFFPLELTNSNTFPARQVIKK